MGFQAFTVSGVFNIRFLKISYGQLIDGQPIGLPLYLLRDLVRSRGLSEIL